MKYISRILFTMGVVLGLAACTEDAIETIGPKLPETGDMSVNISFAMPDATAQTRSLVSGTEIRVHTMQMICFDANGGYLGIRNATLADQTTSGVDTGKIKGTVPQNTSRIHFIANRNLNVPLIDATVGMPESDVMSLEELSTIWNDAAHQEVCYWGYHKENSAEAMEGWLNPTQQQGASKVYMVRDRAKILFSYDKTGATVPVTKIEWLIHNGRERGYLAPAQASWGNDTYYKKSDKTGHENEYISTAKMNEYKNCGRYSLWTTEKSYEDDFDVAYENNANTNIAQFLFDDNNENIDNLKAILKVTYRVNNQNKTVFHVLKLNDDDKNLYDVVRNNTYYIDVKLLSPDVAYYETLEDAINGNEFVNADVEVDRAITDINDDNYVLQILLPTETTSIVFNTEGNHDLDFAFRQAGNVSETASTSINDFEVYWENHKDAGDNDFCTRPTLTYIESTKQFMIHTTLREGKLTDTLQDEWIVVRHKASGLTRYIHVFVIDQFKFITKPTLTRVGTTNNYLLSFTIPPTKAPESNPTAAIYPEGLYPIDVKFATSTLKAYGLTPTGTDYGLFGVSVEGTSNLTDATNFEPNYNTPISSTANGSRTQWYYQQPNGKWWDYWYVYSVKTYPTNGMVNIYLQDVRSSIKYATVANVGLFLNVNYFGKIYSLPGN